MHVQHVSSKSNDCSVNSITGVSIAAVILLGMSGCSNSTISKDSWEHAAITQTQILNAANDNNAAPNSSVVLDNYLESF